MRFAATVNVRNESIVERGRNRRIFDAIMLAVTQFAVEFRQRKFEGKKAKRARRPVRSRQTDGFVIFFSEKNNKSKIPLQIEKHFTIKKIYINI